MITLARPITLRELVARYGGEIDAALDLGATIATLGRSDGDERADLAPVLNDRGAAHLSTPASVLLVSARVASRVPGGRRFVHDDAAMVMAELLAAEEPEPFSGAPIHETARTERAHVSAGARVGRDVVLGEGTRVEPGAVIFPRTVVGARCVIGANAVVGRPGFGFLEKSAIRIPHRAGVVLDDDVELGALATVDAGILSPTRIGAGTKIDAHVHVGHGVVVGARCRIAAQVGLAGSVVIDDDVWIGGQAGVADHCRIGRGARVAAKAGVIGDVAPGETVAGYPAVARARWLRGHARLYRR